MGVWITKLENGDNEWVLELDDPGRPGERVMTLIQFVHPDGMNITPPAGYLGRWDEIAEQQGKTLEDVVRDAIDAAFAEIRDEGERRRHE